MNKNDLITAVAEKTGLSKKDSQVALDGILETIKETIKDGDKVQLIGFGTFEERINSARTGVNPATKEKIQIKESKSVKFKVGKGFKDLLN